MTPDNLQSVKMFFPEKDWSSSINEKLKRIFPVLKKMQAELYLQSEEDINILFILRMKLSLINNNPYYLKIFHEDKVLFEFSAYQEESILYTDILNLKAGETCCLTLKLTSIKENHLNFTNSIQVLYSSAFILKD